LTLFHPSDTRSGNEAERISVQLRSLLEWGSSHGHNLIRSSTIVPEAVLTPPTLPGFYPHSDGPLRTRCILGFDLKPRSITTMMDLGCWDAAI